MSASLVQGLSLTGAALILVAYGGQQYAGLRSESTAYALLNLVGSALLAVSALRPLNAGVLLLETAWAVISLNILVRSRRRPPPA